MENKRIRTIRMSDADWQTVTLACKMLKVKKSELIRQAIVNEINKRLNGKRQFSPEKKDGYQWSADPENLSRIT